VKRVLIIATTTGYQIRAFGEAAATLGVRLVFASDRCDQLEDPWWDQAIPIRFHDEAASLGSIVKAMRSAPPDGVIAVGDQPVTIAARVHEAFRLPGNPPASALATRNKLESRKMLAAGGLLVPAFRPISVTEDPAEMSLSVRYPVVLKPLAMSGSRGVIRANNACEFVSAFNRLRALVEQPDVRAERDNVHGTLLIESFIAGREYAVEGVLTNGRLQLLAIFDKPDPLDGPFFEETIYLAPSREPEHVQSQIVSTVAAGAAALGLRHGPLHAECRVNEHGVYVLEIAARPIGGLCAKALRFVSPHGQVSLEEVLLRHTLGEDVSRFSRERTASGVMMIPIPRRGIYKGVDGESEARRVSGVIDVTITAKPDTKLTPLPEGKSYLGFIFAHAPTPLEVEQALRAAHAKLRFQIDREIAIV
jgi:biotin carboxylase